jgi:hypothetical protein
VTACALNAYALKQVMKELAQRVAIAFFTLALFNYFFIKKYQALW